MIPEIIQKKLDQVRRRERLIRGVWGTLMVLAIALGALFIACLIDWWVDLYRDTPHPLRVTLLAVQGSLLLGALIWFVAWPLLQKLTDATLARLIDNNLPILNHRLITLVELDHPEAHTDGMSLALLESVGKQVVKVSSWTDYMAAIDPQRYWRCLYLGLGVLAALAIPLLFFPGTFSTLVLRQLLADRDIPRSVQMRPLSGRVQPISEPIDLRFEVTGNGWSKDLIGSVTLEMEDGSKEEHPLAWELNRDGKAVFVAKIPGSSMPFHYRALLGDGRMRRAAEIVFESRPALVQQSASEILPAYCGLRPDGTHYEERSDKGNIVAFRESWARVRIGANKPLQTAVLQLMSSRETDASEKVNREIPFELADKKTAGSATFALQSGEHAYRILLTDKFGLKNKFLPRRTIGFRTEDPPEVQLLPERFPAEGGMAMLADTEMDGIPAVPGRPIRIAYRTRTNRALDRAVLRYRVLKDGTEATPNFPRWSTLPLRESKQGEGVGAFDLERGVFAQTGFLDEIEFHAVASPAPDLVRGRVLGGGRFDFKTGSISALQPGSQIEYYIEVYDRKTGAAPGASEIRVKDVASSLQFTGWLREKRNEARKLTDLQKEQDSLYDPTKKVDPNN